MLKKQFLFLTLYTLFSFCDNHKQEPVSNFSPTYKVKKGDTLSKIAQEKFGGDIYAPGGSLEQLVHLNPSLKNSHLIYPGQNLVLVDPKVKLPKDLDVVVKNSRNKN
jgi:LysM repeat protein